MPLQWLPLQQRQQQQQRSPVSEALTPRKTAGAAMGAMPAGESFMERSQRLQEVEAERKFQEKMMKMQHEQGMEKAKFAAGMKEDARKGMTAGQALGRPPTEGAAPALTKENMPEAAKTMWEFISTLDEAGQKFFINQLKQKEQPTGGFIEAGGVRKEMPGSVGMYGHLVDQGLIDPATDTVIKKGREFEKGTFSITEEGGTVYQLNTATGERKQLGTVDEPEGVVNAIVKQIKEDALAVIKVKPELSLEDATHDAGIDYGLSEEESMEIAKFTKMPEGTKKKNAFIEWIKSITQKKVGAEIKKGWAPKGAGAKPAFNEANVTSLVDVITDDVTTAERAHLKSQGASDTDIDEAIKRKGSK